MDFQKDLENANSAVDPVDLIKSLGLHINSTATNPLAAAVLYRVPIQASLDGNTVEMAVEQAAFVENTVLYQFEFQQVADETKDVIDLLKSLT